MGKIIFATIFIVAISQSLFGQSSLTGITFDKTSGEPAGYVSIGVSGKPIGTVSDKDGRFTIPLDKRVEDSDTLIFFHISYEPLKYSISELSVSDTLNIELTKGVYAMESVVVKNRKTRDKRIGSKISSSPFSVGTGTDSLLGYEFGMMFSTNRDCIVNNLNLNIGTNSYTKLKLRLNFYEYDKQTKLPTDVFAYNDIVFDINDNYTGLVTVDLKPHSIFIDKDKSFVTTLTFLDFEVKKGQEGFTGHGFLGFKGSVVPPYRRIFFQEASQSGWEVTRAPKIGFYFNTTAYID